MTPENSVYIATSLDGYIADRNGGLDWLEAIPFPEGMDMGYSAFFESIDALVMGRITFETVCGFDLAWPYQKPVFVLSNSLDEIPATHKDKAEVLRGEPAAVLRQIHEKGYLRLYIDGGTTIQHFLKADLIDQMIITTMPVLLGGGPRLFATLPQALRWKCVRSEVFLQHIVQTHYRRDRSKNDAQHGS
jgi:dihydrofolate reductase